MANLLIFPFLLKREKIVESDQSTISSFVIQFSSHLQSFPASGSFIMSQLFASGGQSIGVSASTSAQFSSVAQLCPTLCNPMESSTPGLPVHHQLLEFAQTHVHRDGDPIHHLILCHPLLLLPSIFPSIRVFSNESALRIRWPKYWSFSFKISSEYSGLISFRMDCLDLLAVQGTLESLLQHHSSKASILRCSAFFIVQLC